MSRPRAGTCGEPGPFATHCTERRLHDYSCYDAGDDSSWNDRFPEDWQTDTPHNCDDVACMASLTGGSTPTAGKAPDGNANSDGASVRRETVGGYPAGDKPAGELSPPPASISKPASVLAPLGAISRAINEGIGRASALGDPALRDLLIGIGHAVDDVINDLEDADSSGIGEGE